MSVLLALAGVCVVLYGAVIILTKKLIDSKEESALKDDAIQSINKANKAIDEVVKEQEGKREETEKSINDRNYFGD